MRSVGRPVLLLVLFFAGALSAWAQPAVSYRIAFPNAAHHEARITATFSGLPPGEPLAIRMSRTSPGRYALHEFAKNVYDVQVTDGSGNPLAATRPDLHQWDVAGHDGTVRFSYTLFGDRADGTYTGINNRYAHLNIPATFVWARGAEEAPVRVTFDRPGDDWEIATQLFPTDDPETFTAPDFAYFVDSPTHLGALDWRSWTVAEGDTTYTVRLAVDHDGSDAELDTLAESVRRIVEAQIAVWQDVPNFEPGTYTFIATYLPSAARDAMEHRNSTMLTNPVPLSAGMKGHLGSIAHEFFHAWNVERLRPRSLEPFDFERADQSGELWFAEGFTNYYEALTLRRAGLLDDAAYAAEVTRELNTVVTSPGRRFFSPVEMSLQAPFVDAATSIDPQNKHNTFISYYTWGSVLGLGLDLTLRGRYDLTLDAYMRALWARYGRPEIPYTSDDLERVLAEVTGDPIFAAEFFDRYVEGRELLDYRTLLARAGFLLRPARPGQGWLGAPLADAAAGAVVAAGPLIGSPLYEAGLERGDQILALGDLEAPTAGQVTDLATSSTPGTRVQIRFLQNGVETRSEVVFSEDPAVEVVPYEAAGQPLSPEARAFRAAWLGE